MRPHISFSELSSFAQGCQWKWKIVYLEGLKPPNDYSPDLDFGTSIHAALEAYHRRKNPISLEHAEKLFFKKFSWLHHKHGSQYSKPFSSKDYSEMIAAGLKIIGGFKKFISETPELKDSEVVHNEFKLFEPIERDDGLDIKFKGYIDIILRAKDKRGKHVIWVCDFKTCSWGWNREKREDPWRLNQLFLYKYYLCKKFNIDPKQVRVAFILLKKSPSKNASPFEFFAVSAGPISVQRALDTQGSIITEMAERASTNDFKKNRAKCEEWGRKCPFLNTHFCPKIS